MVFFTVKKDFSITQNSNQKSLIFQSKKDGITQRDIYVSSLVETSFINDKGDDAISIVDENKISHAITTIELGVSYKGQLNQIVSSKDNMFTTSPVVLEEQIKQVNTKSISIAFIGCFGAGVGDFISSIPAFRVFTQELQKKFDDISIDIYSHTMSENIFKNTTFFFKNEKYIRDIKSLPIDVATLNTYDFYIDTIFFMQDNRSLLLPIVDLSLYKLGIDYTKINTSQKTLSLSVPQDISSLVQQYIKQKSGNKSVVLFHPKSSTILRSVPDETSCLILNTLLEDENIFVISVNQIDFFKHERFLDASVLSLSMEHFFSFIKYSDFCVSSDTSVYHIANSFDVPSVVFFTTIKPDLRIKYYKKIYPIFLENQDIQNIHNETSLSKDIDLKNLFAGFDIVDFIKTIDIVKNDIKINQT